MRWHALAASLALLSCVRETRTDEKPGKVVPAQLIGCSVQAPSATGGGDMAAEFQVDARGKVRDVRVQGATGAGARALRKHLESCEYSPATRAGRPIASRRAAVYQ